MPAMPSALRPRLSELTGVVAGFSTRHGGLSRPPYSSLNLGLRTGDAEEHVAANVELFFASFGIGLRQLATAEQVHGRDVERVSEPGRYLGVDGLVTDRPEVALCIGTADCAAVLLADVDARVIGACHSGWRGTVSNIVGRTVEEMVPMGADARRLHAFVSPCISEKNFEVGEEVAEKFDSRYVVRRAGYAKPHVDLKSVLRDQLLAAGIPSHQIEVSSLCTFDRTDLFFSYRAEDGQTGRMMAFIMLTPRAA